MDLFGLIEEGYTDEVICMLTLHPEGIELIDKHYGWTPLHHAAWSGQIDIVEWLLEHGANVHSLDREGSGVFHTLSRVVWNHVNIAEKLLKAGALLNVHGHLGLTPLHLATSKANFHLVKFFLSNGAILKADSHMSGTPVHIAAANGNVDLLRIFFTHDETCIHYTNRCSWTPLHRAARCDKIEAVKYLIDKGAHVNASDIYGETPLLMAKSHEVIEILLAHGADVCAVDEGGYTILHHIVELQLCFHKTIRLILDHGSDTSQRANIYNERLTARELAQRNGRTKLVEMIDEYDSFPTVKGAIEFKDC